MARTQRPRNRQTQGIGTRLISTLVDDFGLTMTEAAKELGYANATTLHKIKRGLALPDPERLASFAQKQKLIVGSTMNLHWVLTGQGVSLIGRRRRSPAEDKHESAIDDDIINRLSGLEPQVKQALLVLVSGRRK